MSTLRTNALEGVDAKNSITIVAGAGNITTTSVQEGLCKQWCNFVGSSASSNDSFNTASITDNGTGITDAKKATTPYFTTKKTGTGLGLPIVTKIINEHYGNFSIKNKKDDNGTIVKIKLPKYA